MVQASNEFFCWDMFRTDTGSQQTNKNDTTKFSNIFVSFIFYEFKKKIRIGPK